MEPLNISHLKVLVVEDNAHFRNLVRTILETLGIADVVEAKDGAEALETLKSFPADLIILDWRMDGLDGVECLRRIRTAPDSPSPYVPVIMVTGYSEARLIREARQAGVDEFLAKPISAKELLTRLIQAVEQPRPYAKTTDYFGPDRRRRRDIHGGAERRREQCNLIPVESVRQARRRG